MLRKLLIAGSMAMGLVLMCTGMTGCPQALTSQYEVTLENLTDQTYAPLLALTHATDEVVFREGELVTSDFSDFVTAADVNTLVATLNSENIGTDIATNDQGLGLAGTAEDTLILTLDGLPSDVITLALPDELAAYDTFVGLESVPLPTVGSRVYYLDSYSLEGGDVVLNGVLHNLVRVTVTRL